jgi:hypothetical protein
MAADAETVAAEISRSSIAQKTCAIYDNLLKAKEKRSHPGTSDAHKPTE